MLAVGDNSAPAQTVPLPDYNTPLKSTDAVVKANDQPEHIDSARDPAEQIAVIARAEAARERYNKKSGEHDFLTRIAATQMTVRQARKALEESLKHVSFLKSVGKFQFDREKVTFVGVSKRYGKSYDCSVSFAGIKKLAVVTGNGAPPRVDLNGSLLTFYKRGSLFEDHPGALFEDESHAKLFVDALLTLKEAASVPDTEEADFAAFCADAKTWLVATPKPEMPDDARAFKVLAEDAFKRKDFPAALDAYCDALDKYPMWPAGHYNAALLAAEAEDYELAYQHMRRYLVLAPDAKDAAAAKDKLLLWQLKAKE